MVTSQQGKGSVSLSSKLEGIIAPELMRMGYELVDLEYLKQASGNPAVIRIFIDFASLDDSTPQEERKSVGIDDCVTVDRGLNELFESPEFEAVYPGEFTLEVSSPGVDRRLRTAKHFTDHIGKSVKVRTFRALDAQELANSRYHEDNPRQKNFAGKLVEANKDFIRLLVGSETISIPQAMIARANLDLADEILRSSNGKN